MGCEQCWKIHWWLGQLHSIPQCTQFRVVYGHKHITIIIEIFHYFGIGLENDTYNVLLKFGETDKISINAARFFDIYIQVFYL